MRQSIRMRLGVCLLVAMAFIPRMQRATANEPEPRTPQAGATEADSRAQRGGAVPTFGPVIERIIIHPGDSTMMAPGMAPNGIRLDVNASGQVVFDKKVTTFGALEEILKVRLADNKDLPVFISSDATTQYDAILAVLAVVRGCGVTSVHLNKLLVTEPAPPEEKPARQLRVIHLQHLASRDLLKTLQQLTLLDDNLAAAAPKTNLLVLRGDPSSIEEAICLAELLDAPPQTVNAGKPQSGVMPGMPQSGKAAADSPAEETEADPSFECVFERTINHPADSTTDYFLDLDSGKFVKTPDSVFDLLRSRFDGATKLGRRDETINRWARDTGADVTVGFTSPDVTLSLYGGAIYFPTLSFEEAKADDIMKAANDAAKQRQTDGKTFHSLPPLTMFRRPDLDREGAFVFQTREGGIGLLQIVSSTEKPRSVKIRYKLLVAGTSGASSPTKELEVGDQVTNQQLPERPQTPLLGEWKVVGSTQGGEPVDKFNVDGMRWTLGKGTLEIVPAAINQNGAAVKPLPKSSYSIDDTQSPAHFTWTLGDGEMSVDITGIYELKDGMLRVCFSQHGEPRPTDFETKGKKRSIYEFKRVLKE